jgi:hypothetical protein
MQFIKRYFFWAPVILVSVYGVYVYAAPCNRPIPYKIGTFDDRFGINETEFHKMVGEASGLWSEAAGKNVFVYDPDARLTVNLIFDERQALSNQNQKLQSEVAETQDSASDIKAGYESLEAAYKKDEATYNTALTRFEKEQDAYNTSVDYWNARGGAPKKEFDKLVEQKRLLNTSATSLENMRKALNTKADEINALINQYNVLVRAANQHINTINQTAGKEFDEGEYISDKEGKRINIYEFPSQIKLERVLAHEFGHALGLDHNENFDSIMYYLNSSQNTALTADDRAALHKLCRLN